MITRRLTLLLMGGTALAGCPAGTDPLVAWNNFIDSVTQLVARGCSIEQGFVPTAATILNIVDIIFPGIGTGVVAIVGAVQTVANAICSAVTPSPKLSAAIASATPTAPAHLGDFTLNNKTASIDGYNAKYGPQHITADMLTRYVDRH